MSDKICLDYLPLGPGATELGGATLEIGFTPVNYAQTSNFADGHFEGVDDKLGDIINLGILVKSGVVSPIGTVTPTYVGEIYVNTATQAVYIADGLTNTDWQIAPENVADMGDVTLTSLADGDMLAWDGSAWVNTREIGAGHDRNGVADAAILGGEDGTVYPGDGVAPYAGTRALVAGGDDGEGYGDDSVALSGGKSYGQRALAVADAIAGGNSSIAAYSGRSGGSGSFALGDGQADGQTSFAMGLLTTQTGLGVPAVTLANSGPDLVVTLTGELLTDIFTGGQTILLFGMSGGTHDKTTDANAKTYTVASSAINGGDTELTITGVNLGATAAYMAYDALGVHSFAFGAGALAKQNHGFAFGNAAVAWGDYDFAFGEGAEAGETGALTSQPTYAFSFGKETKALHDYGQATGYQAQTRVFGERVHAHGYLSSIKWSQERVNLLSASIAPAGGTTPLYADAQIGGTDEVATFSNHAYAVTAIVLGAVDASGTMQAAAWKLEAVFVNDSGTLTQVGATTVTALGNSAGGVFDTTPLFAISGQDIRITVADDGSGLDTLNWNARVVMTEMAG